MESAASHHSIPGQRTVFLAVMLRMIVTLLFIAAGYMNIMIPVHRADLIAWGYPDGSHLVIGGSEWLSAAMLWHIRSRRMGYVAMAAILAGAVITLLVMGLTGRLVPPAIYAVALAFAVVADRKNNI